MPRLEQKNFLDWTIGVLVVQSRRQCLIQDNTCNCWSTAKHGPNEKKSRLNIKYYPTILGSELKNSLHFHMDGSVVQSRVEGGPIEGRVVQLKTPAKGKKTYMIFFHLHHS